MTTPETAPGYQNQNFAEIRRTLLAKNQLFEDKVFPAVTESLYYDDSYEDQLDLESEIEWLRPGVREYVPRSVFIRLCSVLVAHWYCEDLYVLC